MDRTAFSDLSCHIILGHRGSGVIPRALLRALVSSLKIGVAARVLDVGCGTGELTQLLDYLRADVVGLDESLENLREARHHAPDIGFQVGRVPRPASRDMSGEFDVVLVRGVSVYRDDLFSQEAFETTADLLSCLSPGGRFAFLRFSPPSSRNIDLCHEHSIACYARHVSFFPGVCRVSCIPDSTSTPSAFSRFFFRPATGTLRLAALRVPDRRIPAAEWHRLAREAASECAAPCCDYAGQLAARPGQSNAA